MPKVHAEASPKPTELKLYLKLGTLQGNSEPVRNSRKPTLYLSKDLKHDRKEVKALLSCCVLAGKLFFPGATRNQASEFVGNSFHAVWSIASCSLVHSSILVLLQVLLPAPELITTSLSLPSTTFPGVGTTSLPSPPFQSNRTQLWTTEKPQVLTITPGLPKISLKKEMTKHVILLLLWMRWSTFFNNC